MFAIDLSAFHKLEENRSSIQSDFLCQQFTIVDGQVHREVTFFRKCAQSPFND